jgi:hypothetical protein
MPRHVAALATFAPASLTLALALTGAVGCDVSDPDDENEGEVITTVRLTFTPEGGGAPVVAAHADPENDGNPVIDDIALDSGVSYTLTVKFENELEDPAEDITEEIEDEDDEHQVLVYGDAVDGPASAGGADAFLTHTYNDEDDNGFPVGLDNTIVADAAGTGELRVMLRHLPPENDTAVKNADIAADFAADGAAGIPGDVDADVAFDVTVE